MIENSDKRLDDGIDLTKIYRISNIQDLTIENNKSSLIDDKNENLIKEKRPAMHLQDSQKDALEIFKKNI